jgi:hypothetical protein
MYEHDPACVSERVAKWQLRIGTPFELMKFRLTYTGELFAAGGNNNRNKEKWAIRRQLHPQLAELWQKHPVLKGIGFVIQPAAININDTYGLAPQLVTTVSPSVSNRSILETPIEKGVWKFVPLVRASLKLTCHLDILFLRKEQPGSLVLQGGDLDNRIKTLFDGLSVPTQEQMIESVPDTTPFFCLLEQDSLISGVSIQTDRLLTRPTSSVHEVHLVIEATVKIMEITGANVGFLGD